MRSPWFFEGIPETLGLKLVNYLVAQLDGTIELERIDGAKYIIVSGIAY